MPVPELLVESARFLTNGAKDISPNMIVWGAYCGSLAIPAIWAAKKLMEINFKHEQRAAMANLIAEADEELGLDSAAGNYAFKSKKKTLTGIYEDSITIVTQQGQNERNQKK